MPSKEQLNAITPGEALDSLPKLEFSPEKASEQGGFGRAELLQSVLVITRMDHVTESKAVQDAVSNALGELPKVVE